MHGVYIVFTSFDLASSAVCLFQQASSDVTVSKDDEEEAKRGFTSAVMLPSGQGLLCITADQEFLFYSPIESQEGRFQLNLNKRLVGYNEEIVDMRFVGVEGQFLAVATSVRVYDLGSMSCSYVLAGHTDIVLCLDTCTTSSRRTLIVTGSKDNTLWTVKTNECVATYDQHEDKVWALTVGKKTEMLATGGSDAVINLWHDSTTADKEDAFWKEKKIHRSVDAKNQVKTAISVLSMNEYRLLLEYVREWNTKPKLCHIAQFVLFQVFSILSPTEIVEMKGIGELLEGLILYS
ncbi:putative transcription factor WD40-like family [Helianthus annuus]|nr:putative transcription factor WD40-like family [Helianthus annuus]